MKNPRVLWTAVALVALAATGALWLAPPVHGQSRDRDGESRAAAPEMAHRDAVARVVELVGGRGAEIGVTIRDLPQADLEAGRSGVVIDEVRENTPAAAAGLKSGDVVVTYDGERVRGARHFARLVDETPPGRPVKAEVQREGRTLDVSVTPRAPRAAMDIRREWRDWSGRMPSLEWLPRFEGRWPDGPGEFDVRIMTRPGRLGIGVQDLTPDLARYFGVERGVLVTSVSKDSPGARAGLLAGDVITMVDGEAVDDSADLRRRLWREDDAASVSLGVVRDKKPLTLKVTFDAARETEAKRPTSRRRV